LGSAQQLANGTISYYIQDINRPFQQEASMFDDEKWITVREAAERSGYAVSTVQWLLRAGRIKGWKPGNEWLTTLETVMAYKNSVKRGRPRKED
jgi:excisionase family DNA binding protein